MKKVLIIFFVTICFALSAQQFTMPGSDAGETTGEPMVQYIPQAIIPVQAVPEVADNLQLAISNRQYPVTPGDVYTLTFLLAGETVSNTLLVESDYNINMTIFGKINASGMTFAELKPMVEDIIAYAYPKSLPSLTITSVGIFQVPIKGEVPESRYVTAWGLSRLSELLEGTLGDYSSIRDVQITTESGRTESFDLLKALNQGILDQNPNLRPGVSIVINRVKRVVKIRGEVYKPGIYQLLEGEGVKEVEIFTGGFTPMANTNRIRIDRFSGEKPKTFSISYKDYLETFNFEDGDIVTVPTIIKTQPVVFIEGGINSSGGADSTAGAAIYREASDYERQVFPMNPGTTLYDVLDSLRDSFAPFADLENGFVLRNGEPIPINMRDLVYNFNTALDITLEPFDQITIPVKRPVVYVTGAANLPGTYSYQPQKDYLYYIHLAGGFDELRNKNDRVLITDRTGNRKDSSLPILPGDTIKVISNNFIYNFNQYFPAIATGMGLILTMITISNTLNQIDSSE